MGKKKARPVWLTILEAVGLSLGAYIAIQLLLALLLVNGTLGEGHIVPVLAVVCALSVLGGGIFAVRGAPSLGTLPCGILVAGCFAGVLVLLGLGLYGGLTVKGSGGILLLAALTGGLLAGFFGKRKGKKKARRR